MYGCKKRANRIEAFYCGEWGCGGRFVRILQRLLTHNANRKNYSGISNDRDGASQLASLLLSMLKARARSRRRARLSIKAQRGLSACLPRGQEFDNGWQAIALQHHMITH